MLIATIALSRAGYRLEIAEAPLWALVVEEIALTVCCRLTDHALCRGIGPHRFGFDTGQRLLSVAGRRARRRWSAPIPEDDVRRHFPELLIDLDD
jgi:hypothetical protein